MDGARVCFPFLSQDSCYRVKSRLAREGKYLDYVPKHRKQLDINMAPGTS